jgi:hypothetical protein
MDDIIFPLPTFDHPLEFHAVRAWWEMADGSTMPVDFPERYKFGQEARVTVEAEGCRRLVIAQADEPIAWIDRPFDTCVGDSFPVVITIS